MCAATDLRYGGQVGRAAGRHPQAWTIAWGPRSGTQGDQVAVQSSLTLHF